MIGRLTASKGALTAALLCAFACAAPAGAGVREKIRDGLFHNRASESSGAPLARYVSEEGRVFILDRTQAVPMLKFDDSPEVWVLLPSPAILEHFGPLKNGIDGTAIEGAENLPYSIPNFHVTYAKADFPISVWFWRSVGSSFAIW